jgi:glyoxylate reductase
MARVLVTRRLPGSAVERLADHHEVELWSGEGPPPREELLKLVEPVEGLLCLLTDRIDTELLDRAPNLRAIANYAVGFDNVDLEACAARGIPVGNTPDVLTDSTADLALALILAVARRLRDAAGAVRSGDTHSWGPSSWLGTELHGRTLLVVGPGRIGKAVARRAEAFGMQILYYGPGDDLHALLGRADVVSIHVPLNDQTRGLFGEATLRAMRRGSILVNTARGPIVDQDALRAALHDGHLAGAGLDVTDPEPLPPDHPLLTDTPNLLVLPHIGSATHAARGRMAERAVENLMAALAGQPMPYPAPLKASRA